MKKFVWLVVSCLMVLSLVMASCGTTEKEKVTEEEGDGKIVITETETGGTTETEEVEKVSDVPVYGGTASFALTSEPTNFIPWTLAEMAPVQLIYERVWDGDWAKGYAGGYGTGDVGWEASVNLPQYKANLIAEDVSWTVDAAAGTGTVYITVREGIHYGYDSAFEASRLVGGREVTADDVLWNFNQRMNNPEAMIWKFFSWWIAGIEGEKVGNDEISFTFPIDQLLNGMMFLLDGSQIFPRELWDEYGADGIANWRCAVGPGPFMVEDYVVGNMMSVKRNPNYWMKDPVGPGKGNQLPYLDRVKYTVMPDLSTQQAAFRTGRIDQMGNFTLEDRRFMIKNNPDIQEAVGGLWAIELGHMRTDLPPFNDVNVRRAMMMATDFNEINDGLYEGLGQINTWPYYYQAGYEGLYLGLDDADCPDEVKELYVYNPDKAEQLLTDAGYPNGFKTSILITNTMSDYYSIIANMWAKVGIDLKLDIQELGQYITMLDNVAYEGMAAGAIPPPSSYPEAAHYTGITRSNASRINDPYVNEEVAEVLTLATTDMTAAMDKTRELMKYLMPGAWVIPTPRYPTYTLWWPWIRNYSGENSIGWISFQWAMYTWVDQDLKTSMGY